MHGGRGGGVAQGGGHVAKDRHFDAPMIKMGGKRTYDNAARRPRHQLKANAQPVLGRVSALFEAKGGKQVAGSAESQSQQDLDVSPFK